MEFAAIIPARYASTRFPAKPLAVLGGKPVIIRVCEQAKKVFDHVFVATDDERIFNVVKEGGFTPSGQVYRDHRATFAYNSKYTKIPTWWAPSAKTPSLHVKQSASTGKLTFIINNPNTDMTDRLLIERQNADESWSTFYELTDRYRLTCSEENEQLSILVLDRYNKDQIRSAAVLSGGERFMISLALSLALSSLNRPDMNVNILFIDEGFGTLDAKSLESVMSTLERLQEIAGESNRRVGIISHREELDNRIPTRIRVVKKGEGRSRVEISV